MSLSFLSKKDLNSFKAKEAAKSFSTPESPTPNAAVHSSETQSINDKAITDFNEVKDTQSTFSDSGVESKYVGDIVENDTPLEETGYRKLEFESPAELVAFYDKDINEGSVTLYPWQLDTLEELAFAKPTAKEPYDFILCAANGSGKDAFVIASFAIWMCLCKVKSRTIITSASGNQLTGQTEHYISNLAKKVNEKHGQEIFRIRQRYIRCRLSGSEIRLFATDEEGKAEGYHPIEPNAEMAIIINEAKNVKAEIYRALSRCSGYNYWLEVSTPGAPVGDFHYHFEHWEHTRRVTYVDCPHLSEKKRLQELEAWGEHSPLYRSKYLAEFTSIEGDYVIPLELVNRAKEMSKKGYIKPAFQDIWPIRIGIDIAAGGDENALIATKGNRVIKRLYFRERDTTITARRIDGYLFQELNLPKSHPYINADDGGVGRGVIDQLNSNYGWNLARVNNQSPASNKTQYINRGAENWYRVRRILEENFWFFSEEDVNDYKLLNQLSTRFYKQQSTQGRIALESKADAKANGRPSPDRADAFILSLTGLTVTDFLAIEKSKEAVESSGKKVLNGHEEIEAWHDESVTYAEYEGKKVGNKKGSARRFSIGSLVNRQQQSHHNFN